MRARTADRILPHRKCHKCSRLGDRSQFKPGPLKMVDGESVRLWECAPKCRKADTTHLDTAKPPEQARMVPPYLDDKEPPPPRKGTAEKLMKPPRPVAKQPKGSRVDFHVTRDLARMALSASATSSYARSVTTNKEFPKGQDPMKHPKPKSQVFKKGGKR